MALTYHFDLYPRDDPIDGTKLVRFTKLQSAEYRAEANGTGSGRFSLRADSTDAAFIDPAGLQYVRVVRDDGSTELVVGGFFLDNGDFTALDERGTRLLTFGGAGTLSYLQRAVMAPHTYETWGDDPFDDTWRLYAQSSIFAGGDYLGAIAWRVLHEALGYVNATGYVARTALDDDRTETAIPGVTLGFDGFDDSNGTDWTLTSGEFKAQIGEGVLSVLRRLMEAGLYVDMDPDTFEVNAYEAASHGRDRTGSAWATDVIRFQAPSSGDIDTGNIKSDLKRAIAAFIKRSTLWAGGSDVYGKATGTTDIPWEGFYPSDTEDQTALEGIASVQVGARDDAGDTRRLRIKLGDDESNGRYLPWEHILLDDSVTLHTGTGQWDDDEETFPVAAITIALRKGGDWDCWVDLGSTYTSMAERAFQARGVGTHTHPPNPRLCEPSTAFIEMDTTWKAHNTKGVTPPAGWNEVGFDDSAWTAADVEAAGGTYPIAMGGESFDAGDRVPSDEILLRKEFYIAESDLSGSAVVFKYALDNAGSIYVNGVEIATLGPDFTDTAGNYTGDHETTLARSTFQAGMNCVAIYVNNDDAGSVGAIPPGSTGGGVYIEINTRGVGGLGDNRSARCGHKHIHNDLLGRDGVQQHAGSGITYDNSTSGLDAEDVQAAIDELAEEGGGGALDSFRHHAHGQFLYAVHRDSNDQVYLLGSNDGVTFEDIGGGILFTPDVADNEATDPSIIHWDGWFWMTFSGFTLGTAAFTVYKSRTGAAGDWTKVIEVDCSSVTSGSVWAPEWFIDPSDGTVHVFVAIDPTGGAPSPFQIYEAHPTNRGMTTWTAPTVVTGTSLPSDMIDPFMVYAPEIGTEGKPYKLWYKDETNKHIEYAESDSLTSGFTVVENGDWASWLANVASGANSIEGVCLVRLDDGRWRIYFNENDGFDSVRVAYSESTDDWETWTTNAAVTTPWLAAHGTVIRLRGMLDHEQDAHAHPSLLSAHTEASDPHTGYQKESEKGAASGYASLDGSTKVPIAQIPTGTTSSTVALGDHTHDTAGLIPVDTGSVAYDTSTPGELGITVTSNWGHDGTNAYYDDTGATAGEEAALFYDPATGEYAVITYDFP